MRVVSLVPSLTETLARLGTGSVISGITSYCAHPRALTARLPHVGGTKTPRIDLIRSLEPDLVHMNLEENLREHAEEIGRFAAVFVSDPSSVDDVDELLQTLGLLHHVTPAAESLRAELSDVREQARRLDRTFTFAVPIWKKPWMWCGGDTYVSRLVEAAGGVNVLRHAARYPSVEPEEIAAMKPEVIFLPDEPWRFTEEDRADVEGSGSAVVGPFPGDLFTWHGARTIEGLRFLVECSW